MDNSLNSVVLSVNDIQEIFALYSLALSSTPYGFLARRTQDDFQKILSQPSQDVIATGIRSGKQLVAYSICHRISQNPYPENTILAMIEDSNSTIYHGDGTVVHPDYQGRMLAQRISRLRREHIVERGIDHMLGLISTDNIVSIGNAVLAGILLVGFAKDETSLNYIAYAGLLRERLQRDKGAVLTEVDDRQQQNSLFIEKYAACDFFPATAEVKRQLGFRIVA